MNTKLGNHADHKTQESSPNGPNAILWEGIEKINSVNWKDFYF